MSARRWGCAVGFCLLCCVACLRLGLVAAQAPKFDNLSDADRKVFAERFERDIWPLMMRNGKNGCVGCHSTGRIVSALRLTGDAQKDFRMLLKDGYFLYQDDGSLLARVTEKDEERRMPYRKTP